MNLKEIKIFQHLARSLHFGRTAEAHHLSPSALSRTIQRLEQDCGCALLVRNNRNVKLTDAGQKVLQFADKCLFDWQTLKQDLDKNGQILQGSIRIYCSVTASFSHLPSLLEQFHTNFPQVQTHIQTGDPGLSIERVLKQDVDAAIAVRTPDFPKELNFSLLDTIPLVMIAPSHSSIKSVETIDWLSQPVILPDVGPSKRLVNGWFSKHGIKPNVYASIGGNEAIVSMVALGCGVAIVPDVVVENSFARQKVHRLPMDDIEPFKLGICVLARRYKEPIVEALMSSIPTTSGVTVE
jgi:LysR family positive regulator for ilvC